MDIKMQRNPEKKLRRVRNGIFSGIKKKKKQEDIEELKKLVDENTEDAERSEGGDGGQSRKEKIADRISSPAELQRKYTGSKAVLHYAWLFICFIINFIWRAISIPTMFVLGFVKFMLNFTTLALIVCAIGGGIGYSYLKPMYDEVRQTEYDRLSHINAETFELMNNSRVFDMNGKLLGEVNVSEYKYVDITNVSRYIQEGYIAVEDRDFKSHMGVSLKGIARAAVSIVKAGGAITQGGSTITQQVVKNNFLTQEQTIERKLIEFFLAPDLEQKFTKADIMEFYVNTNFYGNRCYGVESASQYYFGKSAKNVSLGEAAMLVAISNSPSNYNPVRNPELALKRRNLVLKQMYEQNVINKKQYKRAKAETLEVVEKREERLPETYEISYAIYCATLKIMEQRGFKFEYTFPTREAYEVYRERYMKEYGEISEDIRSGGYDIYTSINPKMQKQLQESLDSTLAVSRELQENGKYAMQGAGVCVDNTTNYVVAIVGGRGTDDQYNRGFLSTRQPGSTIKPLLDYAPALESGRYYPSLIVNDAPINNGPKNAGGGYRGAVSVREALGRSINTIAWNMLANIGVDTGTKYLADMEFSGISYVDNNNLSMSLGGFTNGVRTFEMAKGYSTLANGGEFSDRTCIVKVEHQKDGLMYDAEADSDKKQVYSEDTAWMMTDMLHNAMEADYGTSHKLRIPGQYAAAKTGTTNNSKDGWLCGYTRYYTTAVWVGRDDNKSIPGMYGATYAGKIWQSYMTKIHHGLEKKGFTKPDTVVRKNIDSAGRATSYNTGRQDWFSTAAEERRRQLEKEEQQRAALEEVKAALKEFQTFNVMKVEDCYEVEPKYKAILEKLSVIEDDDVRAKYAKKIADKYNTLLEQKERWKDDMEAYEKELERQRKEEAKRLKKEAEAAQKEAERQATINRFTYVIGLVEATTWVTDETYNNLDLASQYLTPCAQYDEYRSLKDRYDAQLERIPELEKQNKAAAKAARKAETERLKKLKEQQEEEGRRRQEDLKKQEELKRQHEEQVRQDAEDAAREEEERKKNEQSNTGEEDSVVDIEGDTTLDDTIIDDMETYADEE